jgi:AbrB family looped-hinge helix DNA binding protein
VSNTYMPPVKIQRKGQMTLPTAVRSAVGLANGDLVDVKVSGRRIIITPTLVIDRSKFPKADDEYTPAQRAIIDARLDRAEKGPVHGPFNSADEMIAHMKAELKKRAAAKKLKRSR